MSTPASSSSQCRRPPFPVVENKVETPPHHASIPRPEQKLLVISGIPCLALGGAVFFNPHSDPNKVGDMLRAILQSKSP